MQRYLLDTSALMALRDAEPGVLRVKAIMDLQKSGLAHVSACFVTLFEIYYRVWKDEGETAAKLAYTQMRAMPLAWVNQSTELLELAAQIKAIGKVSAMDAWVAASAQLMKAVLVHKDPEFETLKQAQELLQLKNTK